MFLGETISVLDTKARNEEKEIFYHGILIGILKNYSGWAVKSNRESGDGYADILLKPKNPDMTQNSVRMHETIFLHTELHSVKNVAKS